MDLDEGVLEGGLTDLAEEPGVPAWRVTVSGLGKKPRWGKGLEDGPCVQVQEGSLHSEPQTFVVVEEDDGDEWGSSSDACPPQSAPAQGMVQPADAEEVGEEEEEGDGERDASSNLGLSALLQAVRSFLQP